MKKYTWLILISLLLGACKSKRVSMAGDEKVGVQDFIGAFDEVKLPYQVTDSVFLKNFSDSSLIGYKVLVQFVPDNIFSKYFPKGIKPDFFPIAKAVSSKKETYLLCKAVTKSKESVWLICMDKSNKFIAAKLLFSDGQEGENIFASIDTRLSITIQRQHRNSQGELKYKKDTYILTDDGKFILILTESNEAAAKELTVINPLDTLPRKHKFSGDYVIDKKNFISVRDGNSTNNILFFVHFEKDNSTCNGELKGEAKMVSPVLADYRGNADPCHIQFLFGNNKVTMKEIEGCGNYRDIKCFFEGVYYKKKEAKPKGGKKKR
jgi:hypothetical protein